MIFVMTFNMTYKEKLGLIICVWDDPRGIMICRGGQGMAIAANRFPGIRASVIWNSHEAKMTRVDNDSNVLCLPADHIDYKDVPGIIETWLNTKFSAAPRHVRRLKEIDSFYPYM